MIVDALEFIFASWTHYLGFAVLLFGYAAIRCTDAIDLKVTHQKPDGA